MLFQYCHCVSRVSFFLNVKLLHLLNASELHDWTKNPKQARLTMNVCWTVQFRFLLLYPVMCCYPSLCLSHLFLHLRFFHLSFLFHYLSLHFQYLVLQSLLLVCFHLFSIVLYSRHLLYLRIPPIVLAFSVVLPQSLQPKSKVPLTELDVSYITIPVAHDKKFLLWKNIEIPGKVRHNRCHIVKIT